MDFTSYGVIIARKYELYPILNVAESLDVVLWQEVKFDGTMRMFDNFQRFCFYSYIGFTFIITGEVCNVKENLQAKLQEGGQANFRYFEHFYWYSEHKEVDATVSCQILSFAA